MKITKDEKIEIDRLEQSPSIINLSQSVLRGLDEDTVARLMSAFLYLKANNRPDSEFAKFMATKELWGTLTIGLNVMGAFIPAMLCDKEFRALVMKAGINKSGEIGVKFVASKFGEMGEKDSI
ncbi:MAG: hypothetical protein ACYCQJ_08060 [Nitrososphaerales archaeon]